MVFTFRVSWLALVAVPVAVALTAYGLRPREPVVAPIRLAIVRGALAVGAYAVLTVELAGAFRVLTGPVLALGWLAGLIAAAGLAGWRLRRDGHRPRPPRDWLRARLLDPWRAAGPLARALAVALSTLVLGELVVGAVAEPNNYDSQTYHLPRIEHWVADADVGFFATAIHRQVTLAPGAEYLLVHLRLLTGGDLLYNQVQWVAGVGCLLVASRIAAQLGGGRRAQLVTAFLVGSAPMVTLQASSTQNDLVVAAWTGCVATLVLDGLRRRAKPADVLALGAATGLTALTKNTGLLAAGPLLALWVIGQLPAAAARPAARRGYPIAALRAAAATLGVLAVAGTLAGPFLGRVAAEFGNPLGPPRLTASVPMQRHDPGAVLVNGLRIAHTALDTPLTPLRDASAAAIDALARAMGVDPEDRRITFGQTTFPATAWYPDEDRVSFPIAGALAIVATVLALARPARLSTVAAGRLRAYAIVVAAAALLYAATVKWQPWGNRLLMFALVLAAPLAGRWLDALLRRRSAAGRPSVATVATATVLAVAALAGALAIGYGFPRRLVGAGSVLTTGDWEMRFLRRPQWAEEYTWAAQRVAGAHRIGLVQRNDDWEYPWWLLLRRDHELVALQSVLPHHPPAPATSVDAIVCTGDAGLCTRSAPRGWHIERRGYVAVALPPTP
jgi:hypothetical protein